MDNYRKVLNSGEKAVFSLRSLYSGYGYTHYKMSKFEEYDLYVKNKDFLVSDNVITFTDTDGKLMALKPDVTLSIIKNGKDEEDSIKKVYYNENVYRVSKGTHSFKEIMQVGLECQGAIDDYTITEVLTLAAKSLKSISDDYLLDISHLGIVSAVIGEAKLSDLGAKKVLACLGDKNVQGVTEVCLSENVDEKFTNTLKKLVTVYGKATAVIEELKKEDISDKYSNALNQLEKIVVSLGAMGIKDNLRIDFSVVNDMKYYNGIVFKGFINGIPTGILSGGQYDNLMEKMGKKSGAIGFAVYLDDLEKLSDNEEKYDVDVVILYSDSTDVSKVALAVGELYEKGETALAVKKIPEKIRYKRLIKL